MLSLISGFGFWQKIGAAVVSVSLIAGAAYLKGRSDGKAIAAVDMLKSVVQDNKDWNNALSDAERLDAVARCVAVGGLLDDCERVLLDQPPATRQ